MRDGDGVVGRRVANLFLVKHTNRWMFEATGAQRFKEKEAMGKTIY